MFKMTILVVAATLMSACYMGPTSFPINDETIDLSSSDETALVTWATGPGKGSCSPTDDNNRWRENFLDYNRLVVDAGPVTVYATCFMSGFFRGPKEELAIFNFVAEAGHTYMVADEGKDCMSLLDTTFEETLIACEPFEMSE